MEAMREMIAGWELQKPTRIYADSHGSNPKERWQVLKVPDLCVPTPFAYAIIDCSDIIDCMASITIRQLPEETKRKLKIRAAENGRSMEQEAREILKTGLAKPLHTGKDLYKAIREIFEPIGGVDLELPAREPIPEPRIK